MEPEAEIVIEQVRDKIRVTIDDLPTVDGTKEVAAWVITKCVKMFIEEFPHDQCKLKSYLDHLFKPHGDIN